MTDLDGWPGERIPAPGARVAFAGLKTSEALRPQWRRAATRLGIKQTAAITVLADGAKWIWTQAARSLPGAEGVLDFYHVVEHVTAASAAVHGEATPPAAARAAGPARVRRRVDAGGPEGRAG